MYEVGQMSKIFFDVFPTLKVNDEIRMLFESVQVEKVSTNRQRDFINVFLFSDHQESLRRK